MSASYLKWKTLSKCCQPHPGPPHPLSTPRKESGQLCGPSLNYSIQTPSRQSTASIPNVVLRAFILLSDSNLKAVCFSSHMIFIQSLQQPKFPPIYSIYSYTAIIPSSSHRNSPNLKSGYLKKMILLSSARLVNTPP